jgi:hypothetical protein
MRTRGRWISDCGPRSQPGVTTLRIQGGLAAGRPQPPAMSHPWQANCTNLGDGAPARANDAKRTQSVDPGPGGYGPGDLTGGAFSRANCAKQTQFAFEQNAGQVLWRKGVMVICTYKGPGKNKPNCPRRGTEAVSGYAGRDPAWGTWAVGQMRKTNPISKRSGATGAHNEGQSCQTKPISSEGRDRQVLAGKRVMVNQTCMGLRRNKAKLGWTGASGGRRAGGPCCAKQSQFSATVPRMDAGRIPFALDSAGHHNLIGP